MGPRDKNSIKWTLPHPGVVKINFDGSVLQQSSGAVVSFVLRDDARCPVVADARCIGKANVSVTKATALRDGLLKVKEMNVKNVVVEGDSYQLRQHEIQMPLEAHPDYPRYQNDCYIL
ncbi:hypothetical protein ACLB2K_058484 [Fragaria x ananassa]